MLFEYLVVIKLILSLLAIISAIIGLLIVAKSKTLLSVKRYLLILFTGLFANNMLTGITRVAQLFGVQVADIELQVLVIFASGAEWLAMTIFVLYMLGLVNGDKSK